MTYLCNVCDKTIEFKSKSRHFKSNFHKEFDTCKHIELTIKYPNINHRNEIFYACISNTIKNMIIII